MEPIDYNSPLGISKKEWTKVLGVNLALLLIVYAVALVCTLCGSDLFILRFFNERLDAIETFLRGYDLFWLVQIPIAGIEEAIICSYVAKKKPSVPLFGIYVSVYYGICTVLYFTTHSVPAFLTTALGISACIAYCVFYCIKMKSGKYVLHCFLRMLIAVAMSFAINEAIALFRTRCFDLWLVYSSSFVMALSIEYDIALALALGFLTLVIPWEKGGNETWTSRPVGGSSPTSTKCSPKNSKTAKINLTPKQRKKIFILKAKVIAIQTVALVVIAFVPIVSGRGIEFSLMYVAFIVTRMILGFSRSLHFKSELSCVTVGALTFWAVTFLAPNVAVSIIMSLVYGCALALGFRLYWELHDLMMYKKAAKTDRYAMFYTAFKANLDPRHIKAIMIMRGHSDPHEIKMVQMYMAKEKVDYIAEYTGEPVRSLDRKLTTLAEELYSRR